MDKLTYLAKTLSRTNRKDYENFVINAIWNKLDRDDIQPVSQQYVRGSKGAGYLIDLYFPQLNIGIEVDEKHHIFQQEQDKRREADISKILSVDQIIAGIDRGSYEAKHIPTHDGNGPLDYGVVMHYVDEVVSALKDKIDELEAHGDLRPWNPELTAKDLLLDKTRIDVKDKVIFRRMVDACNLLFDSQYDGLQRSFITPRGEFYAKYYGEYMVWFPTISVDAPNAYGHKNILKLNGEELHELDKDCSMPMSESTQRVIIPHVYDPILGTSGYRFMGVFELREGDPFVEDGKERYRVWKRKKESFDILGLKQTPMKDRKL